MIESGSGLCRDWSSTSLSLAEPARQRPPTSTLTHPTPLSQISGEDGASTHGIAHWYESSDMTGSLNRHPMNQC